MQDKKKGGGLMKIVDALEKAEKKRAVAQTIRGSDWRALSEC